jgi:hypothetical protein
MQRSQQLVPPPTTSNPRQTPTTTALDQPHAPARPPALTPASARVHAVTARRVPSSRPAAATGARPGCKPAPIRPVLQSTLGPCRVPRLPPITRPGATASSRQPHSAAGDQDKPSLAPRATGAMPPLRPAGNAATANTVPLTDRGARTSCRGKLGRVAAAPSPPRRRRFAKSRVPGRLEVARQAGLGVPIALSDGGDGSPLGEVTQRRRPATRPR